eukprot:g3475.t1
MTGWTSTLGGLPRSNDDDDEKKRAGRHGFNVEERRLFHATQPRESITPIAIGVGIAAVALTGKYALDAYDVFKQKRADGKPIFGKVSFGSSFYKGGFKEDMDRKEAALILGLRESADKKRIQAHHRRLLRLNHPDTGGSTFIATKINEAKDMLLKN